jgi:two-component system, OmpR family, phosphate regulon sensor histidine kinase PhoR
VRKFKVPSSTMTRRALWVLLGTVALPAAGTLTLGILSLALYRAGFDVVSGVLMLVFAGLAIIGGSVTWVFVRSAERLARMQTDFVANVSHELRTPLAGIRLLVETLARGRAERPEKRQEVLELLEQRVDHLERLVERILRWQRLEAGAMELEHEPLEVSELVEGALAPYRDALARTPLKTALAPGLPPVLGDRAALTDALRNLVDNAIKFGGDHGPVEVVARQLEQEILIEVRDSGPGIPHHERKRIFERFYRVRAHMRSKQGTGLGLAIVRQVVTQHGGRVVVESEPGQGSAFIVHLPLAEKSATAPPASHDAAPQGSA